MINANAKDNVHGILLDNGIEKTEHRIQITREKFQMKCKRGLVPEELKNLYNNRSLNMINTEPYYDPRYKYEYKNISIASKNKLLKYKRTITYKEKCNNKIIRRFKQISGTTPYETANKAKNWINDNNKKWRNYKKFNNVFEDMSDKYGGKITTENKENELMDEKWINMKEKMKQLTKEHQHNCYQNMDKGKIHKEYKKSGRLITQ